MDRPYGENVKIVKIPVAWKMLNAEAMFLTPKEKGNIATQRSAEETQGRHELQTLLDDGYKVIAHCTLEVSTGTFIVYTLYDDGTD